MSDYGISIVRTAVPIIVGAIVAIGLRFGAQFDAAAIAPLVQAVVAAAYYVAVRALERRWPQLGALLGAAKCPAYSAATPARAPGDGVV